MQVQGLSDWEKPHLRLFFSADIVGSTAFKQTPAAVSKRGDDHGKFPQWFNTVLAFYHQAEQSFTQNWVNFKRICTTDEALLRWFGPDPELWKTVGDEVLFTKQIEDPAQAIVCCHAWMRTLEDLRSQLKERGLDVKSTAWLADFPLRNQEVVLRGKLGNDVLASSDDEYPFNNQLSLESYYTGNAGNVIRDFIGPSIDTGFRLGALASVRKMVISLELAHVLSIEQAKSDKNPRVNSSGALSLRKFEFRYDGRVQLKGVLGGNPYPVLWIDLDPENEVHQAEDEVLGASKPTAAQIRSLTRSFLQANDKYLFSPYFFDPAIEGFERLSEVELDELLMRHDRFIQTKQKRANEADIEVGEVRDNSDFDVDVTLPTLSPASTPANARTDAVPTHPQGDSGNA